MKTPPEEHQRVLARLTAKHREVKLAEMTMREEIQRQLEERLLVLRTERSLIANEALGIGVSKTRIGRAMSTSDWATVNNVIDLAAPSEQDIKLEADELDREAYAKEHPWSFDDEEEILTLRYLQMADGTKQVAHRTYALHGWPVYRVKEGSDRSDDLDQQWFATMVDYGVALRGKYRLDLELEERAAAQALTPAVPTGYDAYGDPSTWGTAEDEDEDE